MTEAVSYRLSVRDENPKQIPPIRCMGTCDSRQERTESHAADVGALESL